MNLKKTLKRKFYLKYFTLVFLLLLYVPIIGLIAYSARTAHPFQRNGAPFRFKLSKAQQVD